MSSNVTQFNLSSFPVSAPSICIPRVFQNITECRVRAIFETLGLGDVEKIDMIQKTNQKGEKFQRVFIHFVAWNDGDEARAVRQKLLGDEQVRVVYDEPWYWLLSASKSIRPEERNQRKRRPRPYVDLGPSPTSQQTIRETVQAELTAQGKLDKFEADGDSAATLIESLRKRRFSDHMDGGDSSDEEGCLRKSLSTPNPAHR
jgi:hypothetical protein